MNKPIVALMFCLSAYAEDLGRKPWDECVGRTCRRQVLEMLRRIPPNNMPNNIRYQGRKAMGLHC